MIKLYRLTKRYPFEVRVMYAEKVTAQRAWVSPKSFLPGVSPTNKPKRIPLDSKHYSLHRSLEEVKETIVGFYAREIAMRQSRIEDLKRVVADLEKSAAEIANLELDPDKLLEYEYED